MSSTPAQPHNDSDLSRPVERPTLTELIHEADLVEQDEPGLRKVSGPLLISVVIVAVYTVLVVSWIVPSHWYTIGVAAVLGTGMLIGTYEYLDSRRRERLRAQPVMTRWMRVREQAAAEAETYYGVTGIQAENIRTAPGLVGTSSVEHNHTRIDVRMVFLSRRHPLILFQERTELPARHDQNSTPGITAATRHASQP